MKNTIIKVLSVVMAMVMAMGACLVAASALSPEDFEHANDGECAHENYTEYSKVEATCEDWGYTLYECSDCGDLFTKANVTEMVKPHYLQAEEEGLDWIEDYKAPTCAEEGYYSYECPICGEVEYDEIDKTEAHVWGDWVETTKATCTGESVWERTCKVCGKKETNNGDAAGHKWVADEANVVAPTCQTTGSMPFYCEDCDATKTVVILECAHVYVAKDKVNATCTTDGNGKGNFCKWCGEGKTAADKVYEATGHTFDESSDEHKNDHNKTNATCTADGLEKGYCTVCKKIVEVVIPATGHNYEENRDHANWKDATCEEEGNTVEVCPKCLDVKETKVDALGHDFWYSHRVGATCTTAGGSLYDCSRCDETWLDADIYQPALEHNFDETVESSKIPAKAPTCTEDGNTEGYACLNGCTETTCEVIEATGHSFIEYECSVEGKKANFCKDCGIEEEDTREAFTSTKEVHAWFKNADKSTAADCEEAGTTWYDCLLCGTHKTETVDAIGHIEAEKDVASTCDEKGYTLTVCTREDCPTMEEKGYLKKANEKELDPDNHTWVEDEDKYIEPTCYATGTKYYYCEGEGCKATKEETVAALGHVFEVVPGVAATCTEGGLTDGKKCKNCDLWVVRQRDIEPKGHTEVTVPGVEATCHTKGYADLVKCADCKVVIEDKYIIDELYCETYAADTQWADCEGEGQIGYTYYVCINGCDCEECEYITDYVAIPEHVWSEVQTDKEEATCDRDGYWYIYCYNCEEEEITRVTEVTKGHHDKDGNKISTSCTRGEVENIHCEHCDQDIDESYLEHDMVEAYYEIGNCEVYTKIYAVCNDCGLEKVIVIDDELAPHDYVYDYETDPNTGLMLAPTYDKAVWVEKICSVCGDDASYYATADGVQFTVEVVNGAGEDLTFVNGSKKLQVKIYVKGDQVKFNNLFFSFTYNKDAFKFTGADFTGKFTTASDFEAYNDAENGKINVVYFASNDKDGNVYDVTLTGEDQLLGILNFEIKSAYYGDDTITKDATMNFVTDSTFIVVDSDAHALANNVVLGAAQNVVVHKVGDFNNDGKINNFDGLKMLELMAAGNLAAAGDVDFDGEITATDFAILRGWIVGSYEYPKTVSK